MELHYAALRINYPPQVLKNLLLREEVTVSSKIESLELVGATILLHEEDTTWINEAFSYWNEAMDLRDKHPDSTL